MCLVFWGILGYASGNRKRHGSGSVWQGKAGRGKITWYQNGRLIECETSNNK